jgi:HlyD family secretion protein
MGTEMMTIAKLDEMEARVDIGEIDIVLIEAGQNTRLEVDAFKDRKFKGTVTAIANASRGPPAFGGGGGGQSQEAPKFEVRIRVEEKEAFRPGMSVTAEIETRSRKGVVFRADPKCHHAIACGSGGSGDKTRGGKREIRRLASGGGARSQGARARQTNGGCFRSRRRPRENGPGEDGHQRQRLL